MPCLFVRNFRAGHNTATCCCSAVLQPVVQCKWVCNLSLIEKETRTFFPLHLTYAHNHHNYVYTYIYSILRLSENIVFVCKADSYLPKISVGKFIETINTVLNTIIMETIVIVIMIVYAVDFATPCIVCAPPHHRQSSSRLSSSDPPLCDGWPLLSIVCVPEL